MGKALAQTLRKLADLLSPPCRVVVRQSFWVTLKDGREVPLDEYWSGENPGAGTTP